MYGKRVKIFIAFSAAILLIWLVRLVQMQVFSSSSAQEKIAEMELQRGLSCRLNTLRGKILDRRGKVLAADELGFQLNISYKLSCFADQRVVRAKLLQAQKKAGKGPAAAQVQEEIRTKNEALLQVMEKCRLFGIERGDIENKIENINDRVWNMRTFLAWVRNNPSASLMEKYDGHAEKVPLAEAFADFEARFPDSNQRLLFTIGVEDIAEVNKMWPVLELKTEDDIFTAQVEFMDIDGIEVVPKSRRIYPYGSVACQTIGWVGSAIQPADKQLFADDRLLRYLSDEVCGREDGVEYVCESILRGRRGEAYYDANGLRVERAEPQFGKDVRLTLDIELQNKIERRFLDCGSNPKCGAPSAGVVIDAVSGEILALVSTPTFDLNRVRQDYGRLAADGNSPLVNRAINRQYPPGSVIKPLILIAASESGKITPNETISCPAAHAPKGWPDCWIYRTSHSYGHDEMWSNRGGNCARNAIKGSCNIYFSHVAERIVPSALQQWLWNFGYGHKVLSAAADSDRNFRQMSGQIASSAQKNTEQIPPLENDERRWFGIGQGNLRATPLQVANGMATIARGGIYKPVRIFAGQNDSGAGSISLEISRQTLNMVREGMHAVVAEQGGTSYEEFVSANFAAHGVKVYGKTGSTEKPEHAWFGGFAEDASGRKIVVAVLVEGGKHGASDAGPLACDMLRYCIETGYIGLR